MRLVDIRERSVRISRYADPEIPSGGLTTSIVALVTDVIRNGRPVIGCGFSSIGRFAQSGLIRERFAPRLLAAKPETIASQVGDNIDPFKAWKVMLAGEKPGGHGERCVAVGTLDMALWDLAAKIADVPLHRHLADCTGHPGKAASRVSIYGGGGYHYPAHDKDRLRDEIRAMIDRGYTHAKIKIGGLSIPEDRHRIDAAVDLLGSPDHLAIDAMNGYDRRMSLDMAAELKSLGLWWFEDICDPHDLATHAAVAKCYPGPIAVGEALFSCNEAALLHQHGGLRPDRDILVFDPVHSYGLPGYLQIVDHLTQAGWPRSAFWPHGGHLFCLHVVSALGLGGAEGNPFCFLPFGGPGESLCVERGTVAVPNAPGIGFEANARLAKLFHSLTE